MARFRATVDGQFPLTPEEEIEWDAKHAAYALEQAALAATQYQRDRAAAYPSINNYVDGIVKGDQAQVQTYIDACLAVKAKYPKP
jgi:hypothetical protein